MKMLMAVAVVLMLALLTIGNTAAAGPDGVNTEKEAEEETIYDLLQRHQETIHATFHAHEKALEDLRRTQEKEMSEFVQRRNRGLSAVWQTPSGLSPREQREYEQNLMEPSKEFRDFLRGQDDMWTKAHSELHRKHKAAMSKLKREQREQRVLLIQRQEKEKILWRNKEGETK